MAANYRYWCGECHHKTPWLTESAGADQQDRHYAQRHPGIVPGGRVEVRRGSGGGVGCLGLVGLLFLVLLLAATCQNSQSSGAPAPKIKGPNLSLNAMKDPITASSDRNGPFLSPGHI